MNFRSNISKVTLLANEKIKIYLDDKIIEFVPPNLRLYLTDLDFVDTMYLMRMEPKEFKEHFGESYVVENKYEVLLAVMKLGFRTDKIEYYFSLIFPNLAYIGSQFTCGGVPLTSKEYELILEFLTASCAESSLDELMKKVEAKSTGNDDDADVRRMKQAQEKLTKVKKEGKDKKEQAKSKITIDQIVISILYEFKGLGLDDIYSMNMVTLLDFWSYVQQVVDNQIQIVAAGNGLTKKFTYFIN